MTPEQFALHAKPIDKRAFFMVYRPNEGFIHDADYSTCEELENINLAIKNTKYFLENLKKQHNENIEKIKNINIDDNSKKIIIFNLGIKYNKERKPFAKKYQELMKEQEVIKKKYNIVGTVKSELTFSSILIHELFKLLPKEKQVEAMENAYKTCQRLGI